MQKATFDRKRAKPSKRS